MKTHWSVQRAFWLGAVIGAAYSLVKRLSETQWVFPYSQEQTMWLLGAAGGGAIGGALLFSAVAWVRNRLIRA